MKIDVSAFRRGVEDVLTMRPLREVLREAMRLQSKALRVPKRESDDWVRRNWNDEEPKA